MNYLLVLILAVLSSLMYVGTCIKVDDNLYEKEMREYKGEDGQLKSFRGAQRFWDELDLEFEDEHKEEETMVGQQEEDGKV